MVIRNGSKFRLDNATNRALEVAFQFVGSEVQFLKARDISANYSALGNYSDVN